MELKIIKEKIAKEELKNILEEGFGALVKVDVDIKKEILAIGGEFHAEGQELLVEEAGANGQDVWGINFYPFNEPEKRIEYESLINIKPALGARNMLIQDKGIRQTVKAIINKLLLKDDETLAS